MKLLFNLPLDIGRKISEGGKYLWANARIIAIPYWIILFIPFFVLSVFIGGFLPSLLGKYLSDTNRYFYEETDLGEEYSASTGEEENYGPSY
jgi:hypothetical protein